MFDVDEFKRVNDLHGHLIGDKLLEEIAAIMRAMFRGGDMPARFGGEEFAVVLPDADGGRAKTIAERIRTTIEQRKFDFDGLAVSASVSVGVAEWIEGEDSTAFLRRADRAMYASKQAGRNCGHFHDGLITLRIRGAEENKAGSQSNQAEASPIEEDRPRFSAELAQACEGLRRELAKVNDDE
jgi:diguanylate cyclase